MLAQCLVRAFLHLATRLGFAGFHANLKAVNCSLQGPSLRAYPSRCLEVECRPSVIVSRRASDKEC